MGIAITSAVWLFVGMYGVFRLNESHDTMRPGPVISVVQSDVPTRPGTLNGFDPELLVQDLLAFSSEAAASDPKPEMVVWPESPSGMPPLNADWLHYTAFSLQDSQGSPLLMNDFGRSQAFARSIQTWVERERTPILLGTTGPLPSEGAPPEQWDNYNFAIRFNLAAGSQSDEQAKMRLFPVGEYIPWEGSFVHEWLKTMIARESGFERTSWLAPGDRRKVFELSSGRTTDSVSDWRYAVSICNEIMYPRESAVFLPLENEAKPVDFVVNISNHGSFLRNHAMIYHSILPTFRAVEARVGIARSSNTGTSGFVKPTGEIYGEVLNAKGERRTGLGAPEMDLIEEVVRFRMEKGAELAGSQELVAEIKRLRAEAGVSGQSTQTVWVDSRRTLYSQTGDLFGWCCLLVLLTAWAGGGLGLARMARRSLHTNRPEQRQSRSV